MEVSNEDTPKVSSEFVSERILKIGLHLTKLGLKAECLVSGGMPCTYYV